MTKLSDPRLLISLNDIVRVCRKKKKMIFSFAVIFGLLAALNVLMDPVEFVSEGTFREKGPKSSGISSSTLAGLVMAGLGGNENEAVATIKSRALLRKTIESQGLQASLSIPETKDSYLKRIFNHIQADYARFQGILAPSLKDVVYPFKIEEVVYTRESPMNLKISFLSEDSFIVADQSNNQIGEGSIGIPFSFSDWKFTLNEPQNSLKKNYPYALTLLPLNFTTDCILARLKIKTEDSDKNVLRISYTHSNRHDACNFVNSLMDTYQNYLKAQQKEQSSLQLDYLQQRQDETAIYLAELMHKHAESLSEDISSVGFADSEKEMEFLADNQEKLKAQLLTNELEKKRLQNVLSGNCVYYDQYQSSGDPYVINKTFEQIRDLKQQRDSLQIALNMSPFYDENKTKEALNLHLGDLEEIRKRSIDLDALIFAYQNGKQPDTSLGIFKDPKYLIKTWHETLLSDQQDLLPDNSKAWQQKKDRFLNYLNNLKRIMMVHEKIVQERLVHQHNSSQEFQGINLATANELYIGYSRQLNTIEGQISHNEFLINQLKDPNFEISSLSATLTDPVSQDIIVHASQTVQNLNDENNRSQKEQERLRHELTLQRKFLGLHLNQTIQLLHLNRTLTEEKIFDLQNIILELIHQQISLLEKNQHDYIASRLENLEQERAIIQQHLDEIHHDMALLPKRWVAEKLIEQGVTSSELIVQEIAKMVEFKNISHKLELIQSAPIDIAHPSLHPIPMGIMAKSVFGSILGGLLALGLVLAGTLRNGVTVSSTNLSLMNQFVAGSLSPEFHPNTKLPIKDSDLETLRRFQNHFSTYKGEEGKANLLLLMTGQAPDYSREYSELLVKAGYKVITLSLAFNEIPKNDQPGLLQYLNETIKSPVIISSANGDRIEAGGITRFSLELLKLKKFQDLIDELRLKYDWVVAVTSTSLQDPEAENLAIRFPCLAITLNNETLPQIQFYTQLQAENPIRRTAFITTAADDQ